MIYKKAERATTLTKFLETETGFPAGLKLAEGQHPNLRFILALKLLAIDATMIAISAICSALIYRPDAYTNAELLWPFFLTFILFALSNRAYSLELYRRDIINAETEIARTGVKAFLGASLVMVLTLFLMKSSVQFSRGEFILATFSGAIAISVSRLLWRRHILKVWPNGVKRTAFVVDAPNPPDMTSSFLTIWAGDAFNPDSKSPEMSERISRLLEDSDRVVVHTGPERRLAWANALKGLGTRVDVLAPELEPLMAAGIGRWKNNMTLVMEPAFQSLFDRMSKRGFDMGVAAASLVVFAPLLMIVGLCIWIEDRGPVFFRQERVGRKNRRFTIYKFRSMRIVDIDYAGDKSAERADPRVTRIGRFLRTTSIDELPQLFNVLLGQMSIVGPRPHALGSRAGEDLFWDADSRYWHRHSVRPGLTGLAQIRGLRGATNQHEDLQERIDADLEYVRNWTLLQDVLIIMLTVKVLVHRNAY